MPQTGTDGLAEDVTAAYDFAQNWDCSTDKKRRVIVVGASAGANLPVEQDCFIPRKTRPALRTNLFAPGCATGFFLASFLGRTASPPPLALLSIAGINSFTHPFYRSSTLVTPDVTPDAAVEPALAGPLVVGRSIPNGHDGAGDFRVDALRGDGLRDPAWTPPVVPDTRTAQERRMWDARALLYRYLIYHDRWPGMTAALDGGREWHAWTAARRAQWPPTVVFHGSADSAVPLQVSEQLREVMGADRVSVFVAEGQDHLFERAMFLEDNKPGMDAVRDAVAKLVEVMKHESERE